MWPSTDEVSKNKLAPNIRVGFIFITVIFVSGVPLVCALIRVWGDMVLMIDNLRITLPLIVISFKFIIMRWKRKGMCHIIWYKMSVLRISFMLDYYLIYYYNRAWHQANMILHMIISPPVVPPFFLLLSFLLANNCQNKLNYQMFLVPFYFIVC